ncbi:hypothetical protein ACOME3_003844 [Neoechinorhynchus agilis]
MGGLSNIYDFRDDELPDLSRRQSINGSQASHGRGIMDRICGWFVQSTYDLTFDLEPTGVQPIDNPPAYHELFQNRRNTELHAEDNGLHRASSMPSLSIHNEVRTSRSLSARRAV